MCAVYSLPRYVGFATNSKAEEDCLKHENRRRSSTPQRWDEQTSKSGSTYEHEKSHKFYLSLDGGSYAFSSVDEERRNGAASCSRNRSAINVPAGSVDQAAAFIALLRACTKNKDLQRGAHIHEEILKNGLLDKCSDALVAMYAKCGELAQAKALLDMYNSTDLITWTAIITGYARENQYQNALDCFECMQRLGILPNAVIYLCILKICSVMKAMEIGKEVHDSIVRQGLQDNIVLGNALVDMYAKCLALSKAHDVLDKLHTRDAVSWTTMMVGYAQEGQSEKVLHCFERMQDEGIRPNVGTYVCVLKACGTMREIEKGKEIHDHIVRQGLLQKSTVLGNALIDMYARCGDLCKAHDVVEKLPFRDTVSWNTMIAGYAREGNGEQALNCFREMQEEGRLPDSVTYISMLKACASIRAIHKGREIHNTVVRQGLLHNNVVLGNALVDMYAKCCAPSEAETVLRSLSCRDVVTWNSIITGYTQDGQGERALNCFERMKQEGIPPNTVTFICMLKACATFRALDKGKEIHDLIVRQGLLQNSSMLGAALVNMYAKCGALSKARDVLKQLSTPDVSAWNALIAGYVEDGQGEQAIGCFNNMQREGMAPDELTYVCILKACAAIGAMDKGEEIHENIAKQGLLHSNVMLGTALVDMYAKCGALSKAQDVLEKLPSRNVVSWSALIAGYVQDGQGEKALNCFERMHHEGIPPNVGTYLSILKACAIMRAIDKGKEIHESIVKQGLLQNNVELGTALLDMYAKCGDLSKAKDVFQKLPDRRVVSWNALIAGYAEDGQGQQALNCFDRMQRESAIPDAVTYLCILKACATTGAIAKGKEIHDSIMRLGSLKDDAVLGNALVDMYAKCGALSKAQEVHEKLPYRDVVCWNSLIAGYAREGQCEQALNCFERMRREGIAPNAVTCLCVLNMYNHLGLVEEGYALFLSMSDNYGIIPTVECYTSIVDLFARAGHLEKAVQLIKEMAPSDYSPTWLALLGACRKWKDVRLGRWAFRQAIQANESEWSAYVLMGDIYAASGISKRVQQTMESYSWEQS